jgi:hypothetical protein
MAQYSSLLFRMFPFQAIFEQQKPKNIVIVKKHSVMEQNLHIQLIVKFHNSTWNSIISFVKDNVLRSAR